MESRWKGCAGSEWGSEEGCVVPRLKGRTPKASKKQLREANCKIGKVTKLRGATAEGGRVVRQSPVPGGVLAPGAAVKVTLALGH
jgi:beta-lactam-binding protein with PASTA domain